MSKECWQLHNSRPTSCFVRKGSLPCRQPDCRVINRIEELTKREIVIDGWWRNILPHSTCRISSLSPDNKEYQERENV